MELKLLNISYKNIYNNINLTIKDNKITGVYNSNLLNLLFYSKKTYTGNILLNNSDILSFNENVFTYITNKPCFYTKTVKDEFYLMKRKIKLNNKNYLTKIDSILTLVGLDSNYLLKEINTLSTSEKYLLNLALNLIIDPDLIIIELLNGLDKNIQFKLKNIILELKKKYKKTIIIITNNIDILYDLVDDLIIFKDNKVVINDKLDIVFKNLDLLKDLELPNLIKFTNIASTYNKNIKYYKDIKDLIKEVYKNVQETNNQT